MKYFVSTDYPKKRNMLKLLALLFLVGFASASVYDALDEAADEAVLSFMEGMAQARPLRVALGLPRHSRADETDDDIKTELGKQLREAFDKLLEKVKDAIEHGKTVKEDLVEKLKELREKMKEAKVDMGNRAKEILEKIKEKAKDFFKKLLDKLGINDKRRSIDDDLDVALADFNIRSIFEKLKKAILEKIDVEALKEKIETLFGKGSELAEQIINALKVKGEKGKQKLLDLIDRILDDKDKRSVSDVYEKIKEYFKDLNIELKEKFLKFGQWVKEVIAKGLENTKDKIENIKKIAREFVDHSKEVSKEVADEALEFLRQYKEDLGTLWDEVKAKVKEVYNRKD